MSETDQLAKVLENILNPLATDRKANEEMLTTSAKGNPDAFVSGLLAVLKGNYVDAVKQSACFWLKNALSTFHSGLDDMYAKISPDTRTAFQLQTFECVAVEQNKVVRNQLADVIGDVAASLLQNDDLAKELGVTTEQIWPN